MWRNSINPTTEHLVLYQIHKQEEDNFMRERSIQIRKAMTWLRQCDDAASPHFNIKTGRWSLGKGKKQTESYYLEKMVIIHKILINRQLLIFSKKMET